MGRRDGILRSGVPKSRLWSCYLRCRSLSSDQHDPGILRTLTRLKTDTADHGKSVSYSRNHDHPTVENALAQMTWELRACEGVSPAADGVDTGEQYGC